MRKILYLFAFLALASCAKPKDGIDLSFSLENPNVRKIAIVVDRSTKAEIAIDENGEGQLFLPGLKNIYATIIYAGQMRTVFVSGRCKTNISFDCKNFENSFAVSGKDKKANVFLKTQVITPSPSYELEWDNFLAAIDEAIATSSNSLKAISKTDSEFAGIERMRLRYLYGQQLLMYNMWHQSMFPEYQPTEAYYDRLKMDFVEITELADVAAYRQYMIFALASILEKEADAHFSAYERVYYSMNYIADTFTDSKVKQTLLRTLFLEYIASNGTDGTEDLQAIISEHISDKNLRSEISSAIKIEI